MRTLTDAEAVALGKECATEIAFSYSGPHVTRARLVLRLLAERSARIRYRRWLLWLRRTAGQRELGLRDSLDAALAGQPPPQALPLKRGGR